jgi:hypothetical protein
MKLTSIEIEDPLICDYGKPFEGEQGLVMKFSRDNLPFVEGKLYFKKEQPASEVVQMLRERADVLEQLIAANA